MELGRFPRLVATPARAIRPPGFCNTVSGAALRGLAAGMGA